MATKDQSGGSKRMIPVADAPPAIQKLAGRTTHVIEWTNPDGSKVYWFIVDGQETKVPPAHTGH